ncbi:hypothetical protein CFN78_19695 [Amycolatopsis antarctica]|uniref:Adhesin domain-containing protein n=1 Tax=Amycolatopsis antarctica TaxID=1854586 RepID=A0A263CYY8_9PSEU|nr:hypothetical protein [Amycolatopsis antarctica]OZM71390.1 hypothetical protein CFN78_19695 [Amycolatopsis antarctica]
MGNVERRLLGGLLIGATTALVLTGCGLDLGSGETLRDGKPIGAEVAGVRFDVPAGNVTVRVEDGAPASLRRTVSYEGRRPGDTHRLDGDTLVLQGCGDDCSVDYDVVVPRGMAVGGHAAAGNVEVDGASSLDVRSQAGDVVARRVTGQADVDANAGRIDVTFTAPASARLSSGAGDVTVGVPAGPYRVVTDAATGTREIAVANDPAAPHELDLRSSAGDVVVRAS